MQVRVSGIGIHFDQQGGGRIGGYAVKASTDEIQRVGVHHLERTGLQRQQLRHGGSHVIEMAEMDQRGQGRQRFVHELERRLTHHA